MPRRLPWLTLVDCILVIEAGRHKALEGVMRSAYGRQRRAEASRVLIVVERRRQWTPEEKSVLISVGEADAVSDPSPNANTWRTR